MAEPYLEIMEPYNTIGLMERAFVDNALKSAPLSGYIGGNPKGGKWVEQLSTIAKDKFNVRHAIPCNSATSGLLAACMAAGVGPGDTVWTTPYSMSATAACAKVLGAQVRFRDIENETFGIRPLPAFTGYEPPKAVIVANIFGHPAKLYELRKWCLDNKAFLIEDNAQSPFAKIRNDYTGTIGHMGVFSLNIHKHIQCGEGGVIVTDSSALAEMLYQAVNHGELSPGGGMTGLNLRMTEATAAIACAQLNRGEDLVENRREIGLALNDIVKNIPWLKAHVDQPGCKHVYYLWTALADTEQRAAEFVKRLNARGVPVRHRYAPLLHKLFNSWDSCPVAEDVDSRIIVFEVCAYDVRERHLNAIREIVKLVSGDMHEDRAA